jgi:hypothetical protein
MHWVSSRKRRKDKRRDAKNKENQMAGCGRSRPERGKDTHLENKQATWIVVLTAAATEAHKFSLIRVLSAPRRRLVMICEEYWMKGFRLPCHGG